MAQGVLRHPSFPMVDFNIDRLGGDAGHAPYLRSHAPDERLVVSLEDGLSPYPADVATDQRLRGRRPMSPLQGGPSGRNQLTSFRSWNDEAEAADRGSKSARVIHQRHRRGGRVGNRLQQ